MSARVLSPKGKGIRYAFGGMVLLTFFVYLTSLGNGFVGWDDPLYIYGNPIVTNFSLHSIFKAFTSYDPELYLPLTMLSLQLTHLLAGADPFLFHFVSLALHLVSVVLVAQFTLLLLKDRLGETQGIFVGLLTGLLFALHPLNTEAVAWASSRKDVLSGVFYLLTLILYLRYRKSGSPKQYWWSVLTMFLGALSKVIVITIPIMLLLIDWFLSRRIDAKALKEKLPYFGLSIIFGIIALFGKSGNTALLLEKLLIASRSVTLYLQHSIFPSGLSALYPYTKPISFTEPELAFSLIVVVAISIATIFFARKFRVITFCWWFFLIALSPSLTNFAGGQDLLLDVYIGADHYAYIGSIGIFLLVAFTLGKFFAYSKKGALGIAVVIVAIFSTVTYHQSLVWASTDSLFGHVLKHYPNSHIAHMSLGGLRYTEGKVEAALDHFKKSLAIRPSADVYFNLGQIAKENNQYAEAAAFYRKALENRPTDIDARINLGIVLTELESYEAAVEALEAAVEVDPLSTIALYHLGAVYEKLGRLYDARAAYVRVLEFDPGDHEVEEKLKNLQ